MGKKTLYLNCGMGAAGDMLTAALFELLTKEQKEEALKKLEELKIPGVSFVPERSEKCGIVGTHMSVVINGKEEDEDTLCDKSASDISASAGSDASSQEEAAKASAAGAESTEQPSEEAKQGDASNAKKSMNLPPVIKEHFREVYKIIGKAESKAHGVPVKQIHFHEVGEIDAVADISAVCLLMDMLSPDQVIASPVNVGWGHVRCAHGIMPVPTPATANILKDVPIYNNMIKGELCTPTGAALLKHFVTEFGPMPQMKVKRIGYGMGKKDFEAANCVVAMLGETV